jgi:hypothetical protein
MHNPAVTGTRAPVAAIVPSSRRQAGATGVGARPRRVLVNAV